MEHARADLFEGAAWYLTPRAALRGAALRAPAPLVVASARRPVAIDAATHDRLVAAVSHLPHVLANVLVSQAAGAAAAARRGAARSGPELSRRDARGRRQHGDVGDIYLANRAAIVEEIRQFGRALERGRATLPARRRRGATGTTSPARTAALCSRPTSPAGRSTSCALTVPNRPGIVAQVALALGRAGVNIVDMALAPAADMRSGAMTLWVAGDEQAARAARADRRAGLPGRRE